MAGIYDQEFDEIIWTNYSEEERESLRREFERGIAQFRGYKKTVFNEWGWEDDGKGS